MTKYDALLADATELPVADRIELIEALWDTVPAGSQPPLSREWMNEIERRSAEYDSGTAVTVPWDVIRADAMTRLTRKPD